MEFGVEQNTVKYYRYYGIIGKENHIFEAKKYRKYTVKKLICTGLLVRKPIYLKQKIQKIYSEEIGMCSNDINVEKKQCFG
jgi:hypothetical protein